MKESIMNFKKYTFLLEQLVKKEIKLKYRNSFLGVFWTLLEPFLTMLVLAIVFGILFNKQIPAIPVYILSARLLYTFFSNSTKAATKSIRRNASMIKKVYVPKYIYPLAAILANYVMFLISLIVLVIVSAVYRMPITIHMLAGIIPLLLLLVAALGVGLILSTLAVFFRDLEYLWNVALMLIFYACAVFYPAETILNSPHPWVLKINPLYAIIACFRNAVYYAKPIDPFYLVYGTVFAFGSLIIGIWVFNKNQDKFILNI